MITFDVVCAEHGNVSTGHLDSDTAEVLASIHDRLKHDGRLVARIDVIGCCEANRGPDPASGCEAPADGIDGLCAAHRASYEAMPAEGS